MKNRVSCKVAVIAIVLLWASCAYANMLDFFLTDGSNVISFQLDSSPTPSSSSTSGFFFSGMVFILNNQQYSPNATISFYLSTSLGGMSINHPVFSSGLIDQSGPQVFAGTTTAPTFAPGIFPLQDYLPNTATHFNTNFTLTISSPATSVPEPATMLLLGSGLIGLAGYGRKKFFKK